jgi:hypothetical protein
LCSWRALAERPLRTRDTELCTRVPSACPQPAREIMASLVNGFKAAVSGYNQAGVFRKTAGFHRWKMRMKMNKLSNKPLLVGRDQFGNRYFEDSTESFGRNRWVEYARPNKFGGLDPGGAHDGTTDHGFDG